MSKSFHGDEDVGMKASVGLSRSVQATNRLLDFYLARRTVEFGSRRAWDDWSFTTPGA
jgi:hypothetical protein